MDDDPQYEWTPERLARLQADPVHVGHEMFGHEPLSLEGVVATLGSLTAHVDVPVRRAAMTALVFWHHAIDPQTIVRGLADPDDDVRHTAGHVLAEVARDCDDEPAWIAPALLELAGSADAALRLTAVEAASELPRWRCDRAMVDRLRSDPDAAVRSGVLSLLRQRDAIEEVWARATVRTMLADPDAGVCQQAVSMMDRFGTRVAVEPLILLLHSTASGIRAESARVLGELGDRRAVLLLIDLLEDEDASARDQAAEALGRLQDRRAVAPMLGLLRAGRAGRAIKLALRQLADRRVVAPTVSDAHSTAYWTARTGSRAGIEQLVAQLDGEHGGTLNAETQRRAATDEIVELVRLRIPAVLVVVSQLSTEAWSATCSVAIAALGEMNNPQATTALCAILADPSHPSRRQAATALARNPNALALSTLLDSLSDDDPEIRGAAAIGLGRLGNRTAVDPLLSLLGDEAARATREAIIALGLLGDARAFEPIVALLIGPQHHLRLEAAWAVGMLSRDQPTARTRRLGQTLVRCLNSDHYPRRALLAVPLAFIGFTDAVSSLLALLEGDEMVNDQGYAAAALLRLGGARAAETLRRAFDNNHVREVAHLVGKAIDERTPLPHFKLPYWEPDWGDD